jgi:hypothetical protein
MNKKITVNNSFLYVNFIRIDQDMTSEDMFVIAWVSYVEGISIVTSNALIVILEKQHLVIVVQWW